MLDRRFKRALAQLTDMRDGGAVEAGGDRGQQKGGVAAAEGGGVGPGGEEEVDGGFVAVPGCGEERGFGAAAAVFEGRGVLEESGDDGCVPGCGGKVQGGVVEVGAEVEGEGAEGYAGSGGEGGG